MESRNSNDDYREHSDRQLAELLTQDLPPEQKAEIHAILRKRKQQHYLRQINSTKPLSEHGPLPPESQPLPSQTTSAQEKKKRGCCLPILSVLSLLLVIGIWLAYRLIA